jgi:hypothetical protein
MVAMVFESDKNATVAHDPEKREPISQKIIRK